MDIEEYANKLPQFYTEQIPELLLKYLKLGNYETLLDCGCGDGSLLFALKKKGFLENVVTFAIDLSRTRIERLRKLMGAFVVACVDNAETLETIEDHSIDFFISSQVIEHLDDVKMVSSIDRVITARGLVYISTVFKNWYGWFFYRNDGKWVLDPTHLREYTAEDQLLNIFKDTGFELLESRKKLLRFPLVDFVVKRVGLKDQLLYSRFKGLNILRRLKVPIFGYYCWELVFSRED